MSELICPFCGKQMYHPVGKATWSCQNWGCMASEGMIGNHVLWQALINTKKKLDIALKELKASDKYYQDDECIKEAIKKIEQIKDKEEK